MKIVEIKIRRFKELVTGILLGSGARWSFVRLNVVDYVLDGFQFTNKRYVDDVCEIKEDTFKYKILSIKNSSEDTLPIINSNILESDNMLYSFFKEKDVLVAVGLHREDVIYVGKIKDIKSKLFLLDSYDTELKKSGIMSIEFDKVRYVQIHTDYLDSLCLLLDQRNVD